ncbi:E3 ubiquitin-protein ligase RSL1-like [Bidens hawaiensis]|uniref:E3 ubiquitin-protein ligase RSL1-like n=1 Tax=Bidens hawaiensis TaxID=980011 RepID=UPI00404A872D
MDLSEDDHMSRPDVELQALIEALRAAIAMGLKRIVLFCDDYPLYQFVKGQWLPKQQKSITFLDKVNIFRKCFTYCEPSLIARKDVKFAFMLASEAINSQISKVVSSQEQLENCVICFDDKSVDQFFSNEGCTHRFCHSCIKQHVEVKLLNGLLPKCPHDGCGNELRFESCEKFLNPKFTDMMRQRVKEESIPVTEKVYCPYPKCSALMSKAEVFKLPRLIGEVGAVTCYKCHGKFCINCRVPWHNDMNCAEYKIRNPRLIVEESKLKSLAARNLWRQCVKCKHMIELAAGCYHMTCRCGYEFCYTCGAQWKNKKATCTCPLWADEHIMDIEDNYVVVNDNFEHNDFLEDDDFGHDDVLEDDEYGRHDVLEDDEYGRDDVLEDDEYGRGVALEDDDVYEDEVVLEDDDDHEDDDLEEEHDDDDDDDDLEEEHEDDDDDLEEEQEQEDDCTDFEDENADDDFEDDEDVYDDYGDDEDVYDDYGDDDDVDDDDYF